MATIQHYSSNYIIYDLIKKVYIYVGIYNKNGAIYHNIIFLIHLVCPLSNKQAIMENTQLFKHEMKTIKQDHLTTVLGTGFKNIYSR